MKKWFVEVVKDTNGKYHANMMIDSKVVEGLATDVDYKVLRKDIKEKTGISILSHDYMLWTRFEGKDYAYIDCTQDRLDSRVPLNEVRNLTHPWRPVFDADAERIDKQVAMGPYTYGIEFNDIYFNVGTIVGHRPGNIGEMCEWAGNDTIHIEERLYFDGRRESVDETNVYYEQAQIYDNSAREESLAMLNDLRNVVDKLKSCPLNEQPTSETFEAYLNALKFSSFSDEELIFAKDIAITFIGPQSYPVTCINREMVERFEKGKTIDSLLSNAKQRAYTTNVEMGKADAAVRSEASDKERGVEPEQVLE